MQTWRKLGIIFSPSNNYEWMISHAAVPFVATINGDTIKVFFSCRNAKNESSVGSIDFDINTLQVSNLSSKPILSKGAMGEFDDSGAMGCCAVNIGDVIRLYYIGWNLGVTVPFSNSIGIAESFDKGKTFSKPFQGPIIDRNKNDPYFVASNCVLFDEGVYKIWYLSCTEWFKSNDISMHKYHIKYAESVDGIDWDRKGTVAIDYVDSYEYAISVPRVIREEGIYKMWFSSRATKDVSNYRIRYAESMDGISWTRKDGEVNLDVTESSWDSEMICYPYIFDHKGKRYMLYNGNDYGKTGFGLAVLEYE